MRSLRSPSSSLPGRSPACSTSGGGSGWWTPFRTITSSVASAESAARSCVTCGRQVRSTWPSTPIQRAWRLPQPAEPCTQSERSRARDLSRTPDTEREASGQQLLRQAGIERARALIACVDSDAEKVFITLTARDRRPELTIVARASGEEAEK